MYHPPSVTTFLTKAIRAGETATISQRLSAAPEGLRVRYAGPPGLFEIEAMTVGAHSCLAGPEPVAAEGFEALLPHSYPAGTEAICRVRNYGSEPATFVAIIASE